MKGEKEELEELKEIVKKDNGISLRTSNKIIKLLNWGIRQVK